MMREGMGKVSNSGLLVEKKTNNSRLLDDLPAKEDKFGSHERVANAIIDLVENSGREIGHRGCTAIALEGTWGSGKSTVVEIVRTRFPEHVFVFDAWAHKGDPLRRVFLEQLIDFFKGRVAAPEEWQKKRDILSKRIEETTNKVVPSLSLYGLVFAIFTLLIPLGTGLFSAGLKGGSRLSNWMIGGGLFLLLALPFFGVFITFKAYRKSKGGTKKADEDWSLGAFSLFVGKTINEHRSLTHKTADPTSLEFEEIFSELLKETLADDGRRFVLVVDNLDRVPQSDAIALWSNLQVFIECCRKEKADWSRKVWVIVPYDRPAIERIWHVHNSGQSAGVGTRRKYPQDAKEISETPVSFLDKTFQVRFYVPQLILKDWMEFLKGAMGEALPDNSGDEFHKVARIFQVSCDETIPTPREMKLFVNDLSALQRQWNTEGYPLAHLAYYLVLRRRNVDILSDLKTGLVPDEQFARFLNKDAPEHLSSLLFNTDIETAQAVVLRGPIQNALQNGNGERLKGLSGSYGFADEFEILIENLSKEWESEPMSISNAAKAVSSSGLVDLAVLEGRTDCVRGFAEHAITQTKWSETDPSANFGVPMLVKLAESERISDLAFERLNELQPLASDGTTNVTDESREQWANILVKAFVSAIELGHVGNWDQEISVNGEAGQFLATCKAFAKERAKTGRFIPYLKPNCSLD